LNDQRLRDLLDRAALRRLVDAYARGVDRREPHAVAALFVETGRLAIYEGDPSKVEPARVRNGPEEIASALAGLTRYAVTTHFLGQQSIDFDEDGDRAIGETYCIAHHITGTGEDRHDRVLSIRYLDRYVRVDGEWRIEERRLAIDWADEREMSADG
jgi:ketosteroid isomerase-like protein